MSQFGFPQNTARNNDVGGVLIWDVMSGLQDLRGEGKVSETGKEQKPKCVHVVCCSIHFYEEMCPFLKQYCIQNVSQTQTGQLKRSGGHVGNRECEREGENFHSLSPFPYWLRVSPGHSFQMVSAEEPGAEKGKEHRVRGGMPAAQEESKLGADVRGGQRHWVHSPDSSV